MNGGYIHWGLQKKSLYLSAYCNFVEKTLNADELITRLVFADAGQVSFCDKKYFYRVNPQSATQKISIRHLTTLRSYIWLLQFAKTYQEVHLEKIGAGAIAHAWHFLKFHKLYGTELVINTLSSFIPEFIEYSDLRSWIWRKPKHFVAFVGIWLIVRLKANR